MHSQIWFKLLENGEREEGLYSYEKNSDSRTELSLTFHRVANGEGNECGDIRNDADNQPYSRFCHCGAHQKTNDDNRKDQLVVDK